MDEPEKSQPVHSQAGRAMNEIENLKEKAATLRRVLEKYAEKDFNAGMALMFMRPTFDDIEIGKIIPLADNELEWYFFNTESPLFGCHDLMNAAAQYSRAMELWK